MSHILYNSDNISVFWDIEPIYIGTQDAIWVSHYNVSLKFSILVNWKIKAHIQTVSLDKDWVPDQYWSWSSFAQLLWNLWYNLWYEHTEYNQAQSILRKWCDRLYIDRDWVKPSKL